MKYKIIIELFWDASNIQEYIVKARSKPKATIIGVDKARQEHNTDMVKPISCVEYHTCPRCGNEGDKPHTCPYSEELHSDCTECTCCKDCTYQCAMDI